MEFAKGHGTQNDFVVLPDVDAALDLTPAAVAALCDRRRGVGADGLLITPSALPYDRCTIDDVVYGPGTPVFGQPSILWAALTLAILTLPVVIVTTEEALRTVPRELRDASLALGATRFQTLYKVVLPNATGGILTGVILAVSRGAGEVAPIIFTGAANFLPYLPTDLRDMFMHLGYHVYALATQSPDVDAAAPTLFGTVLVLLGLTFTLNLLAVVIRSRSRAALRA